MTKFHVHNITARPGTPRSMWYGTLAEARYTATAGPVKIASVPDIILKAALVAASIWNRFVPNMEPRYFNITTRALPGTTVGQIEWPCLPPPNVCNVTIDPSYGAPINVLVHEFGHGLGLPQGSESGIGTIVDATNHWAPNSVDPREIMTAIIDASPYLSLYTLRAMDPNHLGCVGDHNCPARMQCYATSIYDSPGACELPSRTIVNSKHTTDDYGWAYATGVVGACLVAGLVIAITI